MKRDPESPKYRAEERKNCDIKVIILRVAKRTLKLTIWLTSQPESPLPLSSILIMSVRIHRQLSVQRRRVKPTKTQTTLEQPPIDRILQPACEVLPSDERFDRTGNEPLLVHVDQGLKVHGWRKWWQGIKHLRVCQRRKVARDRFDANRLCGGGRVDQIRQTTDSL
jgi:hypothetical protein